MIQTIDNIHSILKDGGNATKQETMLCVIAQTLVSISATLADIRDALTQEGDV
jgi:hypothetical protein